MFVLLKMEFLVICCSGRFVRLDLGVYWCWVVWCLVGIEMPVYFGGLIVLMCLCWLDDLARGGFWDCYKTGFLVILGFQT